jgi:hypothetical protein
VIDVLLGLFLLAGSPLLFFLQKKPVGYLKNIFNVLAGKNSWVGYSVASSNDGLPKIRKGILNPLDLVSDKKLDEQTIHRLNSLYAKDYHVTIDLKIVKKGWTQLGR